MFVISLLYAISCYSGLHLLKQKNPSFDFNKIVMIGCKLFCSNDNFLGKHWWKVHHYDMAVSATAKEKKYYYILKWFFTAFQRAHILKYITWSHKQFICIINLSGYWLWYKFFLRQHRELKHMLYVNQDTSKKKLFTIQTKSHQFLNYTTQ